MMLGSETVGVVRAPSVVQRGTPVADWGNAAVALVAGCSVQPGVTRDDLAHRDAFDVAFTVFMPPCDVTGRDRLRIRGKDHPIIGSPDVWVDVLPHVVVRVSSWEDL